MCDYRILMFCHAFPPHIGGLESHAEEFATEMLRTGAKIVVFTSDIGSESTYTIRDDEMEIYRYPAFEIIPSFPIPKIWSGNFRKFWKEIKARQFDLQITRTRFFLSSLFPVFYGNKHVPWLHIEHGSGSVRVTNQLTSLVAWIYDELIGRYIFNCAWRVIAISVPVQKFIGKYTKRDIAVINRGMDFEFLDSCNAKDVALDSTKIRLGFVGRLCKIKNVESTIKAVLALGREDIIFYVVGDGEDRERLEKSYKCDKVVFMGEFDRRKAVSFLKNIDVYIHSSDKGGGLSTSLLEAVYCGCRIVASPFEGGLEIERFAQGVVLAGCEVQLIREGILTVLNQRRTLSRADPTQIFKNQFSWSQSIDQYNKHLGR